MPAWGRALPARYTIDLESLPEGEAIRLTQEIGRSLREETKLAPAVGLAEHSFAAQMAAALTRPNHLRAIAPDEEQSFLADCSVSALLLSKEAGRRLRLLGIYKLGQLAKLPGAELQARFGREIGQLKRLVGGEADTKLASMVPQPVEMITRRFKAPLTNRLFISASHKATMIRKRLLWLSAPNSSATAAALLSSRMTGETGSKVLIIPEHMNSH